ncbi:MAG: DUF2092 domain-containing protein [Gemmatimonadaceae bacterium]
MRLPIGLATLTLSLAAPSRPPSRSASAEDMLARSAAAYAALQSYADDGTVTSDIPGVTDRYRFRTFFRRQSHDLFFDWQGVSSYTAAVHFTTDLRGHHTVIWMVNSDMQKYDAETGAVDQYPAGSNQTMVLTLASSYTRGVSTLIPSLLYTKADLLSTLRQIQEIRDDGRDVVDGQPCRRLVGVAADQYARTGRVLNVRQLSIWIDEHSLLIRKFVEEAPADAGSPRRLTILLHPEANPTLTDDKFQFKVPRR